jgi:hypothetical protein
VAGPLGPPDSPPQVVSSRQLALHQHDRAHRPAAALDVRHHHGRTRSPRNPITLVRGAIVIKIGQPDLSFPDGPLAPVVLAHEPIVRFAMNQWEQPTDGVAPGRKAGRRWHNSLMDLETVISHMTRYWLRLWRHEFPRAGWSVKRSITSMGLWLGEATALYAKARSPHVVRATNNPNC